MMIKMIFVESMMEMISVASPLRWEDGGTTHGKTIQSGMMQVVLKGAAIIFNIIIIMFFVPLFPHTFLAQKGQSRVWGRCFGAIIQFLFEMV